jgi:hypothetical protein
VYLISGDTGGEFPEMDTSRHERSAMIEPLDICCIVRRCLEEHTHVTASRGNPARSGRDAPGRASRLSPRQRPWPCLPQLTHMQTLQTPLKRPLELEENLQRKDLSAYERSRLMVQLKETAKEAAQEEEFRRDPRQNPPRPQGGRPKTTGSSRDVERRTGIPDVTMQRAEAHIQAVAKYPALGNPDASQSQALLLAKVLDELPQGEGGMLLQLLEEMSLPWVKLAP